MCQSDQVNSQIKNELGIYELALENYRSGSWDVARFYFWGLVQAYPERKLYSLYFDRCTELLLTNPGCWSPEFVHTSK
ncbi:hypothetical protein BOW53_04405 [Solemya pervernicosa gill symbiont]|uniref:Outer membrane lipoprotein BamD-like domain-containing protein n=1 Tax=Solemya pervernicosa gill symbiont TaxID=642797 RepID=A0A1T2L8D9_9GAMM|nr:hypothetical protein BOW53_04405 [Solemya pervernicosa gill symbiont]